MHWMVDGNNVMGAGADGWWNDRVGAAERLTQTVAEWTRTHDDKVTMVFDGRPEERLEVLAGGGLTVAFARRAGRDAADDRIVELVEEALAKEGHDREGEAGSEVPAGDRGIIVVTSDRGLAARLPPGVEVEGAGRFRRRLGLGHGSR